MLSYVPEINALFDQLEVPLTVVETPEKGKHVVAKVDLPSGAELFEEIPLVSWPMDTFQDLGVGQCWWCLRILTGSAAATTSASSSRQWCSEECLKSSKLTSSILSESTENSLVEFHNQERGRLNGSLPISVVSVARCIVSIAARMVSTIERQQISFELLNDANVKHQIFKAATKAFNRLVEPPQNSEFKDISIESWVAVLQKELRQPLTRALLQPLVLLATTASSGNTSPADGVAAASKAQAVHELVDAMLAHATINTLVGQLTVNSQALNCVVQLPAKGPCVLCMGAALFTLQSNFNHSCRPNAMVSATTERNHEILVVAKRPIAKGEEVTISYIPTEGRTAADRREELRAYFFTCECSACKEEAAHNNLNLS